MQVAGYRSQVTSATCNLYPATQFLGFPVINITGEIPSSPCIPALPFLKYSQTE